MFNSTAPRYAAIHMRMGGMSGEPSIPFVRGGGGDFGNFLKAAQCAQRLAKRHALPPPVLMVVDSNEVRDALKVRAGRRRTRGLARAAAGRCAWRDRARGWGVGGAAAWAAATCRAALWRA